LGGSGSMNILITVKGVEQTLVLRQVGKGAEVNL